MPKFVKWTCFDHSIQYSDRHCYFYCFTFIVLYLINFKGVGEFSSYFMYLFYLSLIWFTIYLVLGIAPPLLFWALLSRLLGAQPFLYFGHSPPFNLGHSPLFIGYYLFFTLYFGHCPSHIILGMALPFTWGISLSVLAISFSHRFFLALPLRMWSAIMFDRNPATMHGPQNWP